MTILFQDIQKNNTFSFKLRLMACNYPSGLWPPTSFSTSKYLNNSLQNDKLLTCILIYTGIRILVLQLSFINLLWIFVSVCVECGTKTATCKCDKCESIFCSSCFDEVSYLVINCMIFRRREWLVHIFMHVCFHTNMYVHTQAHYPVHPKWN